MIDRAQDKLPRSATSPANRILVEHAPRSFNITRLSGFPPSCFKPGDSTGLLMLPVCSSRREFQPVSTCIPRSPLFLRLVLLSFSISVSLLHTHRTHFGFSFVTQWSASKSRLQSAFECTKKEQESRFISSLDVMSQFHLHIPASPN